MMIVVSVLIVVGLLIWALRTKKYSQALFALVALASIDACIIGAWFYHAGRFWQGALLIAIGLAALLGTAIAVKRLYFSADRPAA
jgi:cyanate permease